MADPITRLFSLGSKLKNLPDDKEKAISGYGFYDWGKSAFECSVTLAIIPVWYTLLFLKEKQLHYLNELKIEPRNKLLKQEYLMKDNQIKVLEHFHLLLKMGNLKVLLP